MAVHRSRACGSDCSWPPARNRLKPAGPHIFDAGAGPGHPSAYSKIGRVTGVVHDMMGFRPKNNKKSRHFATNIYSYSYTIAPLFHNGFCLVKPFLLMSPLNFALSSGFSAWIMMHTHVDMRQNL
jgi:hypothetical protein